MGRTYHTDGKQFLLDFLRAHADRPYTIEELIAALPPAKAPGKSTVYRLMTGLTEQGAVRRFVRGNSRQFTYQYFDGADCHSHLHLKCVECGRVVHLDHDASEYVEERLLKQNHFSSDERDTMLMGRCERCAHKR